MSARARAAVRELLVHQRGSARGAVENYRLQARLLHRDLERGDCESAFNHYSSMIGSAGRSVCGSLPEHERPDIPTAIEAQAAFRRVCLRSGGR